MSDTPDRKPLIELRDASRTFATHTTLTLVRRLWPAWNASPIVQAVRGTDLALHAGEILGLVGESGSGKTTLAQLVAGMLPLTGGERQWLGTDVRQLSSAETRAVRLAVQMVHQDAQSALNPRLTVETLIGEAPVVHRLITPAARSARVAELLDQVGLEPGLVSRRPAELSGGQRSRVSLARALAVNPRVLVADEPTASLDVSVQAQVANLLLDLRERHRLALLIVSHDLALVRLLADRLAVMHEGRIVEVGGRDVLVDAAHHPYTRALVDAAFATRSRPARRNAQTDGQTDTRRAAPILGASIARRADAPGCYLVERCAWALPQCKIRAPLLREVAPGHLSACHRDSMC